MKVGICKTRPAVWGPPYFSALESLHHEETSGTQRESLRKLHRLTGLLRRDMYFKGREGVLLLSFPLSCWQGCLPYITSTMTQCLYALRKPISMLPGNLFHMSGIHILSGISVLMPREMQITKEVKHIATCRWAETLGSVSRAPLTGNYFRPFRVIYSTCLYSIH